jgi:2-polyprenyl-6-methoxyphenol hydroxylase-like FAD-dependent oxidoreductase
VRVGVVGFGVAGGALAVQLARAGHDVTVFEQAAAPGPVGAGLLLQPSGQAVLDQMGLLAGVRERSWPIRTYSANRRPGAELIRLRYDRRDTSIHALGVARGTLFTALFDAALRAGVHVEAGCRVVDVVERDSTVTAVSEGRRPVGTFDWLAGTDGTWSVVRSRLNPRARLRIGSHGAMWALGEQDEDCPEELHQEARGSGILTGLLPVGRRTQTFFWGARADLVEPLVEAGFDRFSRTVEAILPAATPVLRSIGSFERMTFGRYGHATRHRLHSDRVVLLGDAAHACPPHLGQGANLALLDAAALAGAFAETDDARRAFTIWRRRRAWQNRRYVWLGRLLSPTFQSDHAVLGMARDIALPILASIGPVRDLMERTLAGRG